MNLPPAVINEVVRQQELMGLPDTVPAYAEIPDADGRMLWHRWGDLTIGLCEQLVEHHSRKAQTALTTWKKTGTLRALRNAGKNILYARLYRCLYISLLGKTDSTEADMPQFS